MAMSARAKWMASIIVDVFKVNDSEALEVFRGPYQPLFDDFFKGVGSNRIFIYYQTQYKISESGEIVDLGGQEEFIVSDGEKHKLKGKGVYFVRMT